MSGIFDPIFEAMNDNMDELDRNFERLRSGEITYAEWSRRLTASKEQHEAISAAGKRLAGRQPYEVN
ncbi:MAG: hypothetical protein AB7S71_18240 [Dongiaceae bacterium]